MKKFLSSTLLSGLLLAGAASAQNGMAGGQEGLHQYNANTLGQWNISVGTGGDVSLDNWSLARGGLIKDDQGKDMGLYERDGSFAGAFNFSIGILNWLDLGVNLPIHYEYAGAHNADMEEYGMTNLTRGDIDAWLKAKVLGDNESVFSAAVLAQVYFPTGEKSAGVRPRHAWYLTKVTNPYTAGEYAAAASAIFSLNFAKFGLPLHWNTQAGFLYVFGDDHSNVLLYSTGLNYLVHKRVDIFVEFSGEMRVDDNSGYDVDPLVDPMILTPGLRFHVTKNIDFGMGLEVAVRTLKNLGFGMKEEMKNAEDYQITYANEHGKKATYGYASTPHFAGAATLVYRFGGEDNSDIKAKDDSLLQAKIDSIQNARRDARLDSLSKTDSDKDGVSDLVDRCHNTPEGASVDSVGCPLDSDKDGVADGLDKCPSTEAGIAVDETGCESDFDKDGIVDRLDKCPNTPAGLAVDSTGCPSDSDKDGINDAQDKCPNTAAGVTVDETGCPLDFDKDGVFDVNDKCPNTPAGVTVDETGCPLDADKDGIADAMDKCPNTPAGMSVDSTGCPLDFDKDGVPDAQDKCPNTLPGVKIDANGCPVNKKQDLDNLKKGINFQTGSAKLTKNSYGTLDDIVALMKLIPEANLEVQGHTDENGSDETNKKLSQDRAQAVVDYFTKKGIDSSRLRAVGYGSSKPIADNKSKEGRQQNRRVELVPFTK